MEDCQQRLFVGCGVRRLVRRGFLTSVLMLIVGQQGKARIVHLFQMKDAFQTDDQHQDAGQKTSPERAVIIGETLLGDVPPAEHLGQQ